MPIFLEFDPPKVTSLSTDDDFVLHLITDGQPLKIDFKTLGVFQRHQPLQDLRYFQTAKLKGSLVEWDDDFHMDLDELVHDLARPGLLQIGLLRDADLLPTFCATMSGLIKVRLQKMSLWLDAVDALTDSAHIKSQVAAWLTTEDSLRARFNSYWDAYSQKLNATDMLAYFEKIFYEIDMVQEITKANNFGQKWLMKEIKDAQTVETIKWFSELSYADLVVAYEPIHEKFKSDFQADVRNIMSSYLKEFDSTLENIDSKFDEIFSVRRVTHLKVIDDLKMLLLFDGDNQARSVDFSKIIPSNPSLTELTDPSLFKKAKIFGSAVRWEDLDIDIEAADLYEVSVTLDRYVEMWHQEKPKVSLQDYLGLDDEEYQAFAHGENALKQKIRLTANEVETRFNRGEDLSNFFATEVDSVTHKPKRKKVNFEEKYRDLNAEEAWDHFFSEMVSDETKREKN